MPGRDGERRTPGGRSGPPRDRWLTSLGPRGRVAPLVAAVALVGLPIAYLLTRGGDRQPYDTGSSVRVIAGAAVPAGGVAIDRRVLAMPKPAPPITRILAAAPPPLRRLHDEVAASADAGGGTDERRLGQVFAAIPELPLSELTVTCGKTKCEVHGVASADEASARNAIRGGAFLDRVAALGYTSGMDMVSVEDGRSEIVVYLDRAG